MRNLRIEVTQLPWLVFVIICEGLSFVDRTAKIFRVEFVVQCVNQLPQRSKITVGKKIDLALFAGTNVMLDTDEVVLGRAQRLVNTVRNLHD